MAAFSRCFVHGELFHGFAGPGGRKAPAPANSVSDLPTAIGVVRAGASRSAVVSFCLRAAKKGGVHNVRTLPGCARWFRVQGWTSCQLLPDAAVRGLAAQTLLISMPRLAPLPVDVWLRHRAAVLEALGSDLPTATVPEILAAQEAARPGTPALSVRACGIAACSG
jgi:hypothetical protein